MRPGPVAALRGNRDFRLLWVGQFTSELGSSAAFVALPLIAIAVTGSVADAGLLGTTAYLASWLGSVPMGYLADRFAPRSLMLGCDAVRLVVSAVLVVCAVTGYLSFWLLAAAGIVTTLAALAFWPAAAKLVRSVVPVEQTATAVAANQLRGQAAALIGPVFGGGLFHLGRNIPLVADAVSFAVSLCCIGVLRPPPGPAPSVGGRRRFLPDLGQGFRVLWRTPFLRALTGYATVSNIAVSILTFTIILGPGAESGGPAIGAALSVGAAAAMVGTALAPRLHRRLGLPTLLKATIGLRLAGTVLAAVVGGPAAAIAALATVLLLQPIAGAAIETARLIVVPPEVYGRVSGTSSFFGSALQPAAPLLAGAVIQGAGAAWSFGVVAALFVVAGLLVASTTAALRAGVAAPPNDEAVADPAPVAPRR